MMLPTFLEKSDSIHGKKLKKKEALSPDASSKAEFAAYGVRFGMSSLLFGRSGEEMVQLPR